MACRRPGGGLGLQTNLGSFVSGSGFTAVANCARFISASSQYLSHADAAGINTAAKDWSLQVWVYPTATGFIASKASGGFASREYRLFIPFVNGTTDPIRFNQNDGTSINTSNLAKNTWFHVVVTFNNTTNALITYINGSSAATGTSTADPAGTSDLRIGADDSAGSPANYANAYMALYGTWPNRILSAGDVTALYNGGQASLTQRWRDEDDRLPLRRRRLLWQRTGRVIV